MRFADRVLNIKPSATLSINAKAQKLRQMGVKVINFAVGEPDFDTPYHIKQAAVDALKKGFTRYTPASGIVELKEAVCEWIKKYYNLHYLNHNVLVSCGGKHAIFNVMQAILNPGDEVIIPSPYWVSYPDMVIMSGGVPVIVPCPIENGYKLTPGILKDAIGEKTRILILNSPSNPTGVHYSRRELEGIIEVIKVKHDLIIISDDIYSRILFGNNEWANIVMVDTEMADRTVIIQAVSKTYAMTGWRIGFAIGNEELISMASKVQSQSTSNPCSIAQWAAVEALRGDQSCVDEMTEKFEERANYVVQKLRSIDGIKLVEPQGAFYAFPDLSEYYGKKHGSKQINNSTDMADYLMEHAHIAVVPGIAFGEDRCVRFSFALSERELEEGLNRFEEALKNLR